MKTTTILAMAIILLSACKKEIIPSTPKQAVSTAMSSDAQKVDGKHSFSVKGTLSGTNTVTPTNACAPGVPLFVGKGSGISSHSGTFTWAYADCATSPHQDVDTYPNGDKIFYSQVGQAVDPATGFVYQDFIATGGTGRFEGITGTNRLFISKRDCTTFPVCIIEGYFEGTMTTVH